MSARKRVALVSVVGLALVLGASAAATIDDLTGPPTAVLNDVTAVVNTPVQLDASASFDPDGDALTFAWDLDNDGQFDDATGARPTFTFTQVGDIPIAVLVTASDGLSAAFAVAHVGARAPVANSGGPYTASPGQTILLDATASADPDGLPITFGWDLNNDGIYNDSVSPTPAFTVGNVPLGTVYTVCVNVTNSANRSNSSCSVVTVGGDATPPTVEPMVTGTLGDNGWYTTDVHVSWQIVDLESPIGARNGCAESGVTSDTTAAGITFSCSATSAGGTSPVRTVTIKRDATAPTITATRTPAANGAGWNADDVTIAYTCDDHESGLAQCSAPIVLQEGASQTATGTAKDNAGNTASAVVSDINVDKSGPSLSGAPATSPNVNGWYRSDVPVHWACSDALSGVDSCPADTTITGEGSNLTSSASAADRAGNLTAAVSNPPVDIDRTPPATNAAAPSGWTNKPVTVTLSATDNLSGVAVTYYSLDGGPTTSGSSVEIDGEGAHTLAYWSVDGADNVEATKSVTVQIDKTAPTVTYSGNAGIYGIDETVSIACVASDALSGVDSTTCADLNAPAASFGVGTTSRSASATDRAGNTGTGTVTFTVTVSCDAMKALIERWVSNGTVVTGLGSKVDAICSAPNATAKAGKLDAFANQLDAQVGKSVTREHADLLEEYAGQL